MRPNVAFDLDDAQKAADAWGFNCGPGALCAVSGLTPDQIRPLMGDFEAKGYTNPTLVNAVLGRLPLQYRLAYRGDNPAVVVRPGPLSLVRVQWAGRWTNPGVPIRARYRHTHWVAVYLGEVFDINAICVGGWMPMRDWSDQLVPWLLRECVPGATGKYWVTHVIEVKAKEVK